MQKIQNLKYYTNSEIGIVRDADSADALYANILRELRATIESTKGLSMAEEGEK